MIRFSLQNLQFFLGAESCFVDTRQLVVIQLPVHKISELNIYPMRPKKTKHGQHTQELQSVVHSTAHTN